MSRRAWLPLFVLALAVAACSSREERVQRHLERARQYLEESWQPDLALVELQAALKLDPQNAETNYRMAELLRENERWNDALFYYEEAMRLDPSRDDATLAVAHLIRFTDVDRAEALIEQVLSRSPGSALAHVLRSDVFLVRRDVNSALASAYTAAELDSDSARAALQVAMVRKAIIADRRARSEPVERKLFEEADAAFAHANELAKKDEDFFWLQRGVVERARVLLVWGGHKAELVRVMKDGYEVLKVHPAAARGLAAAARAQARLMQDDDYLHWSLSRLVEIDPSSYDSWIDLADLATKRGEDGLGVIQRLVAERPDDPRAHITYAEYLSGKDKNAEAVAHLEGVLPESPDPAAMLAELVSLELARDDPAGAAERLTRLRSEHPDSPRTFFSEATLARYEGRTRDAIAALEKWTSRDETPNGFAMLAEARLRAGNPRDALDAIDRAISLSEKPLPAHQRLRGRILVRLGEYRSALQSFSRGRQKGELLPLPFVPDLARALYEVGRPEEGRQILERALAQDVPPPGALLLFARQEAERDPKAARAALDRGASLYPDELQFVAMLGTADFRARQPEAALERVRAAVARLPDSPQAHMLLAQTLLATEHIEEAVKQVELVQQRWPGGLGVAELYLSAMTRAGRGDEAFQSLAREHELGRLSAHGRVLLARLHTARGEAPQAIELLRSALDDMPDLPAAANDLAYALAQRGEQLQEATELAQEARANRPDSSEIADTLGYVYLRRELAEAALVQFDAALELAQAESPGWATAQFHRGLALQKLGRQPEAVAALEQALASGADFAEVQEAHRALAELANTSGTSGAEPREGS